MEVVNKMRKNLNELLDETTKKLLIGEGMFLAGFSLRAIERHLKINRKVLASYLKKEGYGIEAKTGNSGYDKYEKYEKAVPEFLEGKSIRELAKKYGFSRQGFSLHLKDQGIQVNATKPSNGSEETLRKIKQAKELYNEGKSIQEIKKEVKLDGAILAHEFKKMGIDTIEEARKYKVNEDIFKTIDTGEKAYWLGFLYADGSVTFENGRYVLELGLKAEDVNHLEKFKRFIDTDAKIDDKLVKLKGKKYMAKRIAIHNKKFVQNLIKNGCTPRKSLNLSFPDEPILPKEFVNDFIRGYLDGDGNIKKFDRNTYNPQVYVSFTGTEEFLTSLCKWLDVNPNKFDNEGNAFRQRFGGNNKAFNILFCLYDRGTVFLDRKKEIFDEWNKYLSQRKSHFK